MQASMTKLADYKNIASKVKMGEVKVTPEEIERLRLEKERLEKERVRREILDKISEESQAEIPRDLIEREKNFILDNLKRQVPQILQITFEDYLKKVNKTEKEISDSILPEAKKKLMGFLILGAIAEKEQITVSEEEINKESEAMIKSFPDAGNIDREQLKEYTKNIIRNEKTLQFLEKLTG